MPWIVPPGDPTHLDQTQVDASVVVFRAAGASVTGIGIPGDRLERALYAEDC